jgi:hypothetical protein
MSKEMTRAPLRMCSAFRFSFLCSKWQWKEKKGCGEVANAARVSLSLLRGLLHVGRVGMWWDGVWGWDGMGWNGMEWNGMGWVGLGWDRGGEGICYHWNVLVSSKLRYMNCCHIMEAVIWLPCPYLLGWKNVRWLSCMKIKVEFVSNEGMLNSCFVLCICSIGVYHIDVNSLV